MTITGGVTSALQTAVSGARKNEVKVAEAANEIQRSFIDGANAISYATATGEIQQPPISEENQTQSDMIGSITDMKIAAHAYQANLNIIETVDDMMGETIDMMR